MRSLHETVGAIVLLACISAAAQAQNAPSFPAKPGRIIVGSSPGGGTDIMGRILGANYGKVLGQSYHVENIPGGTGSIGWNTARRADPDGYTLYMGSGNATNNMTLQQHLPWP